MSAVSTGDGDRPCWFVGAVWNGTNDQFDRFIADGIWENSYQDKYLDTVKSVRVGDRIAIKAVFTRKKDLPFDSQSNTVSVMAIKATGTVTENPGDGRRLKVRWMPVSPPREWYFYTNQRTIWRVDPGKPKPDALIAFAFDGADQDISQFRQEGDGGETDAEGMDLRHIREMIKRERRSMHHSDLERFISRPGQFYLTAAPGTEQPEGAIPVADAGRLTPSGKPKIRP